MPASLYRMAGKRHPVEVPVSRASNESNAQEQAPEVVPAELTQESFVQSVAAVEPLDANNSGDAEPDAGSDLSIETPETAKVYPTWDASWSKTQLLAVANELGLGLTSINTKSEIVSALTAATSN